MRDLSKALPIEELDEESRQQGRSARAAKVAAMPVSTPVEKGLQRQYSDINKILEDLLFLTKRADEIKIDGEDKKESIVKKIREGIHSNHEQEGYLQIARELNYVAAEKFRAMDSENNEFGEETKKKLDEI